MATPLLSLRIASKRDVLLARQRARQLAGLLGLSPFEKMQTAAAAFDAARWARQAMGRAVLRFESDGSVLRIVAAPPPGAAEPRRKTNPRRFPHHEVIDPQTLDEGGTRRLLAKLREVGAEADAHRFVIPLPTSRHGLADYDVTWLLTELSRLTPLEPFDEVALQNTELLQALAELNARTPSRPRVTRPAA